MLGVLANLAVQRERSRLHGERTRSRVWGSKKISVGLYVPLLG